MAVARALVGATLLLAALAWPAHAEPDTEAVYGDGLTFAADEVRQFTTHQQQGADLVLPTGAIVASDAIAVFGAQPLERTVEPGRYRVVLTVTTDQHSDKRVAFARVELRDGVPVRWEPAAGYGVESGTGAFMDAQVAEFATQNFDFYGDSVLGHLTDVVTRDEYWTSVVVDPSSGADAVVFTSGYGDGGYGTYWGIDADDEVVCLVTDFLVLNGTTRIQ
jgi:hypothetical protein